MRADVPEFYETRIGEGRLIRRLYCSSVHPSNTGILEDTTYSVRIRQNIHDARGVELQPPQWVLFIRELS